MVGTLGRARVLACAGLLCGCGREPRLYEIGCEGVAPGDLAFTEIHANPNGSDGDGDGEYIELYNGSGHALELEGATLRSSRDDGTGATEHRFGQHLVPTDNYFVLGHGSVDGAFNHLDYSYGSSLGSLRNANAALSLLCGEVLIDEVSYASTRDGHALELDGALAPAHDTNDDPIHWCDAPDTGSEFLPGNFGTPGAPNTVCAPVSDDGRCLDGDTRRPADALGPGEARITEWMPNPAGADGELEWVEVVTDAAGDLHGLRLGPTADALSAGGFLDACFPVDAGQRIVFGASPEAAPRVDAELDFSLGNQGPRSLVLAVGNVIIDQVSYTGSAEGISWQIDDDGTLCPVDPSEDLEYGDGNFGTPAAPNPPCPAILLEGMCFDEGIPRDIVHPSSEQAQITEWMANPASVDNRDGEWVEVQFTADVDLNGLAWSDAGKVGEPIESPDCLRVPAGAHAVFARNAHAEENGGIPFVDARLDISLNNTEETIALVLGDEVLDSVSYERARAGVATQIDDRGVVCDATSPYGAGDLGTPGGANQSCF